MKRRPKEIASSLTSRLPQTDVCYKTCNKADSQQSAFRYPYRIFISYSHYDKKLAFSLKKHLFSLGLLPITDHEIRVGEAFSEEIREMIECAHVFIPLVTQTANLRLWVQQEIGYATALHVPICPIAIGDLPAGMNAQIQGVQIEPTKNRSNPNNAVMKVLKERLRYETIDDLVCRARQRTRQGRFDCATHWSEREELLITLTESARKEGCKLVSKRKKKILINPDIWRLRQRTAFGSFSIPDASEKSVAWEIRDPHRYHTEQARQLLRRERKAMEKYMSCFGCDLIIDPRLALGSDSTTTQPVFKHTPLQTALRTQLLIHFINQYINNDKLRVVIPRSPGSITTNLNIVGDWFATEAVVPHYQGGGYERTMFTRHAPTVLNMIDRFDQDFRDCLHSNALNPNDINKAKAHSLRELKSWKKCTEKELSKDQRKQLSAACKDLCI